MNWIEKLAAESPFGVQVFTGEGGGFRATVVRRLTSPLDCSAVHDSGSLFAQGQPNDERGGKLARRRYQDGHVYLRGKRNPGWYGRWLEDELQPDGTIRRVHRHERLGSKKELPTKRLAQRVLDERTAVVNSPVYRARPTASFEEFAQRWQNTVLIQYKPSTQATIRSHFRKYLVLYFGKTQMRDIHPEMVQQFISTQHVNPKSGKPLNAKTKRNLFVTLQMVWKTAKAWGYVAHDALDGVQLPKQRYAQRVFFTVEEVQRIISASPDPCKTVYWLAAETGMRAGELFGLRVEDLDLERGIVQIRQSVWHGKLQEPKTNNAVRTFALSPQLVLHLAGFVKQWRPNELHLLFASRNGTPVDAGMQVKRKLRPLLRKLNIVESGLHSFRHTNCTFMDRLGAPLKLRQQRLGHSDPRLTLDRYTHVTSEDDVRIAAKLGEMVSGIPFPSCPKLKEKGAGQKGQPLVN